RPLAADFPARSPELIDQWPVALDGSVPGPEVGVRRGDAHQLRPAAADEDRDRRIRPRLAVGVPDPVVAALERRGRLRPHRPQDVDGLTELLDPRRTTRIVVAEGLVLVRLPPRPDPEDDPPTRQRLEGGGHLR